MLILCFDAVLTQIGKPLSGKILIGPYMVSNQNTTIPADESGQRTRELENSSLCSAYMRVLSQTSVRADFMRVSKRHSELLESLGQGASRISIK